MASPFLKKYDVFLSFKGEDTRNNFTSHLHKALLDSKIETFVDGRLKRGDEISCTLLRAIEQSKLSVIILSENYASSSWCLDELVHILRCKERNGQIVLPVFYHVSPSDVRKQCGRYAGAFVRLAKRFKDDAWKIDEWRAALTKAANLSGWDAPNTRSESELVEKIVKDIKEKLRCVSLGDDLNGLFGIGKRIEHVESLLLVDLSSDVRIVGIWGMGGVGKTTLANVVFNRFYHGFEGYYLLENVSEQWKKHGRTDLRNRLFTELLEEKNPYVGNVKFIKDRLCRKRVLVVLDDLDDSEQFEYLVGGREWFRPGSRIIITTRNKQVLENIGVDGIYMVDQLNDDEALQLFCLHAFRRNSPMESYLDLSRKVIDYAAGLPLALKVLGSHLYSKSEYEWESALQKLKVVPNRKIQNILKISYDDLDDEEKDVFLDVACFFKGESRCFVKKILDDRGSFADVIRVLVDKTLIAITTYDELWMHDLVQEMGREIVRQECIKEPGMRSRLWNFDEVCRVLKNDAGSAKVEAISLNTSEIREDEINLKPTVFKSMYNLRLLHIFQCLEKRKLHLPQGLDTLPDALRYLNWPAYPLKSLPSSFMPQNLVELNMPSSQLEQLPNEFQHLGNLKVINLSFSKNLSQIPSLTRSNLKRFCLEGCKSLVEVPSLRFEQVFDEHVHRKEIVRTEFFITTGVSNQRPTETEFGSFLWLIPRALDNSLDLSGCLNLKFLSVMSGSLRRICLHNTAVEELHPSMWRLRNLSSLDLHSCKCLRNLPRDICQLESLEDLDLRGCVRIDRFPELPKNIRTLRLSQTAIEQVPPSSFESLPSLEDLYLENCSRLKTLPASICKLKSLLTLNLSGCSNFKSFPEISEPMECLEALYLEGTGIRELHSSIENLTMLHWLFLNRCKNLEFVPNNIYNIRCLEFLDLSECPKLESLPALEVGFHCEIQVDIIYENISKVPDWYRGLSSLPMFDPSGTMAERRHRSMERLSNMFLFSRGQGEPILFTMADYFTVALQPCRCATLDNSNFSELLYCGCSKLDEGEEFNMAIEFLVTILCDGLFCLIKDTVCPRIILCCPGTYVPWWFIYQSKGSSIHLQLADPCWHTQFLGFAFCFVVKFENYCFDLKHLNYRCEYDIKTNSGETRRFTWSFQRLENAGEVSDIKSLNSEHMFMGYLHEDSRDYCDASEVSFEFSLEQFDSEAFVNNGKFKVKECGIRMLCFQDAEDFGAIDYFSRNVSIVATSTD